MTNFSTEAQAEVVEDVAEKQVDRIVFESYSLAQKRIIMLTSGLIGILTPFTDTIYLPALVNVQQDFSASDSAVSATVSAYLAAVGVGQLVFGPLSDRYGRLPVIYGGLLTYEAITIGCIFAPTMNILIILRTIQGFLVSSSVVAAQAIIADVFAPEERGAAMGAFMGPLLIGPVIAPLIGGALAGAYGWRSTFVLLAVLTVPIVLQTLICIRQETHHYFKATRLAQISNSPSAIESVLHETSNKSTENPPPPPAAIIIKPGAVELPPLMMPWASLIFAVDIQLAPYYAIVASSFAGMFTSLTLLPIYLAQPPYNLSPTIIGITYVPVGVAMFLGSAAGGSLSDYSLKRYGHRSLDGRMTLVLWGLCLIPPGVIAFGFSLGYGAHLAAVLITQCVLGFGQAMLMPSTMGYLSSARPTQAGAAGSVLLFLCFVSAAVGISLSVIISQAVGVAIFFVIVAGIIAAAGVWAAVLNLGRISSPTAADEDDAAAAAAASSAAVVLVKREATAAEWPRPDGEGMLLGGGGGGGYGGGDGYGGGGGGGGGGGRMEEMEREVTCVAPVIRLRADDGVVA